MSDHEKTPPCGAGSLGGLVVGCSYETREPARIIALAHVKALALFILVLAIVIIGNGPC